MKNPRHVLDLSDADEHFRERFWSKVDTSGDCWVWTSYCKPNGYGQFVVSRGVFQGAHRVSYALTKGPIPKGYSICHKCDNPPCVRPDHLFAGTQSDNAYDMLSKGRARRVRGEDHRDARLTEADVLVIRATPPYYGRCAELSRRFGVSWRSIRCVLDRTTWRHV